jgi:uncharacterized membrane protein YgdD (TMEM256/DUF423 family)
MSKWEMRRGVLSDRSKAISPSPISHGVDLSLRRKYSIDMQTFLFLSAVSGFLSVALGAFGAHALRDSLDVYHLGVFKTGVEYQFFHTFALAMVAWLIGLKPQSRLLKASGYLFAVGILVFSGSLYALAISGVKTWGAVTPLGGVAFLIGWGLLVCQALKWKKKD